MADVQQVQDCYWLLNVFYNDSLERSVRGAQRDERNEELIDSLLALPINRQLIALSYINTQPYLQRMFDYTEFFLRARPESQLWILQSCFDHIHCKEMCDLIQSTQDEGKQPDRLTSMRASFELYQNECGKRKVPIPDLDAIIDSSSNGHKAEHEVTTMITCDICNVDLTSKDNSYVEHYECTVCPEYDLCGSCARKKATSGDHLATHEIRKHFRPRSRKHKLDDEEEDDDEQDDQQENDEDEEDDEEYLDDPDESDISTEQEASDGSDLQEDVRSVDEPVNDNDSIHSFIADDDEEVEQDQESEEEEEDSEYTSDPPTPKPKSKSTKNKSNKSNKRSSSKQNKSNKKVKTVNIKMINRSKRQKTQRT